MNGSDWEESVAADRRSWEEDGTSEFEAVREEVHGFDGCINTLLKKPGKGPMVQCTYAYFASQKRKSLSIVGLQPTDIGFERLLTYRCCFLVLHHETAVGFSFYEQLPATLGSSRTIRGSERMKVLQFPASRRLADVKLCASRLNALHGEDANRFWRAEMVSFVASLRTSGADDDEIRHQAQLFLNAVQIELEAGTVAQPA